MAKKEKAANSDVAEKKSKKNMKLYGVITALVILLVVGGVLGYKQYDKIKDENAKLRDPQASAQAETERLKEEVASLIDVPRDENPTIASVVDVDKLKNQAFFAKAQNGDKVLMYQQAKKAILYRPSTKKIIEVAPINIGNNNEVQPKTDNQ